MKIPDYIKAEIEAGALFVVNHSGGKDSQAMAIKLKEILPPEQVLAVHAILPEVDWEGIPEHIEGTLPDGWELIYCQAGKTFFEMVERRYEKDNNRPCFPSPAIRQCTSDLKRGPIDKAVRHWLKAHPEHNKRVVHCVGIRAEESSARAKAPVWKRIDRESKAGREVFHWHPIAEMLIDEVFETIKNANEKPHWAYEAGMSRLSCAFCIMGSKADLATAARLKPDLYQRYVDLEKKTGFTMMMSKLTLEEVTGIPAGRKIIPIKEVA